MQEAGQTLAVQLTWFPLLTDIFHAFSSSSGPPSVLRVRPPRLHGTSAASAPWSAVSGVLCVATSVIFPASGWVASCVGPVPGSPHLRRRASRVPHDCVWPSRPVCHPDTLRGPHRRSLSLSHVPLRLPGRSLPTCHLVGSCSSVKPPLLWDVNQPRQAAAAASSPPLT